MLILQPDYTLPKMDGMEVKQGIILMGEPTWHKGEWRCLANCFGSLAVVVLNVKVVGEADAN